MLVALRNFFLGAISYENHEFFCKLVYYNNFTFLGLFFKT